MDTLRSGWLTIKKTLGLTHIVKDLDGNAFGIDDFAPTNHVCMLDGGVEFKEMGKDFALTSRHGLQLHEDQGRLAELHCLSRVLAAEKQRQLTLRLSLEMFHDLYWSRDDSIWVKGQWVHVLGRAQFQQALLSQYRTNMFKKMRESILPSVILHRTKLLSVLVSIIVEFVPITDELITFI